MNFPVDDWGREQVHSLNITTETTGTYTSLFVVYQHF